MRALGLHVKAATIFFGVTEPKVNDDTLALGTSLGCARLAANGSLNPADAAGDLYNRLAQEFRTIKPDVVAMLSTRKYANWKYSEAFDRIFAITVAQLACHDLGIRYEDFKTEAVGKTIGVPAKDLGKLESTVLGFSSNPTYWTTGRAHAFATAATATIELA